MADRRRQIAALRAKADSTTFPAEAAACRAKADELEALEPAPPKQVGFQPGITADSFGGLWGNLGGVTIRFTTTPNGGGLYVNGQAVKVTNVQGNTYTVWVE